MNRPAALLTTVLAVTTLAVAACGSGNGDEVAVTRSPEAVSTEARGATPGSGSSVQPGNGGPGPTTAPPNTPAPNPTPEPSETSRPQATPTVSSVTFTAPDSSSGTKTSGSYGPLGIVYADSAFGAIEGQNRIQAVAFVNVGINERPSASAWLVNNFRVPGEGTAPVTAQISTGVNWQGILAGNGAGGTRAAVTITLSVGSPGGNAVASEEVHAVEHLGSVLTVGGFDDIGRKDVDLQVALTPGVYELRLTVMCEASSGFIGAATHCIYGPSDLYNDGFVAWEPRTILFVP